MDRFPTRCVHAGTMRDELKKGINSPISDLEQAL